MTVEMHGWPEGPVDKQTHGKPLHHPLPRDEWMERNDSASRNSFDLISRLFRSFFFLDSYGLGNNLKINLSSSRFTQAPCLAPLTIHGNRCTIHTVLLMVTDVFQDSGTEILFPSWPGAPGGSSEMAWHRMGGSIQEPERPWV